jgi:Fur family transcriptional regulator, peroxide stress response regulator
MDISIESLTEQLKSKNIRPSYQRVKVLEYMVLHGGHPTVDEIYRALSTNIPSLSKVTIYNTLHTFVKTGLLRVVDIDGIEKHYDMILNNHGHFQCEACSTIYNFQVNIEQFAVEGLDQFEITEKNVYFKGLCPNCVNPTTMIIRREQYE